MPNYDLDLTRTLTFIKGPVRLDYGASMGFFMGFFVSFAKSPAYIFTDCLYGAFLGFILAATINLLTECFRESTEVVVKRNIGKLAALKFMLTVARDTQNANLERFCLRKLHELDERPIAERTRAKTQAATE